MKDRAVDVKIEKMEEGFMTDKSDGQKKKLAELLKKEALKKGEKAVLVDDVATTGKALIEAKQALDKIGVTATRAIVIVDREEGARENLAKAGLELESIFRIQDLGI